jgi:hypothetical protein
MHIIKSILITLTLAAVASAQQTAERRPGTIRPAETLSAPDRLLVQHRVGADEGAIQRAFSVHGAVVNRHHADLHVSVLNVDAARRDEIQKSLEATGLFNFVEPDYLARVEATPNDPAYSSEWHLAAIQAPGAWNYTVGSAAIRVGMIDSGVDGTHPDLIPNLIGGYNFLTGTTNTSDTMGHGTTTAGTVAAAGNNGIGAVGVEWTSAIMPLVVVDSTGTASYSNIANAITYAANNGVRIVNISIGGTSSSSTLQSAVTYAWNKGTVVFASAGNGGLNAPYYPAGCQYAVAVGATDQNNNLASFSNYGSFLSVVAPGVSVYTTAEGGGYEYGSGTSYSSPIAAGVGALMLSYSPSLSASALVSRLEQTATDLGTAGFDSTYGWGLVNATSAVSGLTYTPPPPAVSITAPTNSATVSGTVAVQGSATAPAGLSKVQLFVDGTLASTVTSSPYSFNWNSTSASNAAHVLTVEATDTMNNVGQTSVTAMVNNPVITAKSTLSLSIKPPTQNGNNVTVTALASDSIPVTQVSIYIDGVLDYTGTVAPYTLSLNAKKLSAGTHTATAKAWDATNNVTAGPVTFTVSAR